MSQVVAAEGPDCCSSERDPSDNIEKDPAAAAIVSPVSASRGPLCT